MNIAIIGAGAMGTLLASYLCQNNQVTLIDVWQNQIDHIQQHGLRRERDGIITITRPSATTQPHQIAACDVVLVLVKYHQTPWAAQHAQLILASDGVCITLQNGIGGVDVLRSTLGAPRVSQGVTSLGATLLEVGYVKHAGIGESVFAANHPSPYIPTLIDAFNQSGLPARQYDNLDSLIWGKLIVNAGINALTAILRVQNGELATHPGARELVTIVVNEAVDVAHKLGITLPYDDPVSHVLSVARATAANRSSTLQDVLRGSPSEIATINGAIVRAAGMCGVSTPYNRILLELMEVIDTANHELS
ncbi:MAG: 2-dehydropantoate 2-reductase [Chloroflexi bacterium]|nr:2-dehydropantoate 2-reductase [Chloroflexota bacterium]